jgi:hypothetical protein
MRRLLESAGYCCTSHFQASQFRLIFDTFNRSIEVVVADISGYIRAVYENGYLYLGRDMVQNPFNLVHYELQFCHLYVVAIGLCESVRSQLGQL